MLSLGSFPVSRNFTSNTWNSFHKADTDPAAIFGDELDPGRLKACPDHIDCRSLQDFATLKARDGVWGHLGPLCQIADT
jgi:hypothetical protein